LGLEIYEPFDIGPLRVEHLAQSFVGLRFPLDLSGGVPAFRHRRGNLERVVISTDCARVARWMEARLKVLLGPLARPLDVWWHESGLSVGLVRDSSALTWDLHWAPILGDARWVVSNARGWGGDTPALAEVLRFMDVLAGKLFERRGRALLLKRAGRSIGRTLLPGVGARAPAAADVTFSRLHFDEPTCRIELDSALAQAELSAPTMRAVEISRICETGDEALLRGDFETARNQFLFALESSPRQPELVLSIAELDLRMGRVEAALGLIEESMPILASSIVGAQVLIGRGEIDTAREVLSQAATDERYAPLASLLQLARARLEEDTLQRRLILDTAVAAAPSLAQVRWARLDARAQSGDASGATADAQHLEAAASGRQARFLVCRRAADSMLSAGFETNAATFYQRALRYAPDDVGAMLGLATALHSLGDSLRAIPLLERAIQIGTDTGQCIGGASVTLAGLVATKLGDLPQAVSRLRSVPNEDPDAITARGLEGRYRLMLGDVVGASLAYGRMRELIAVSVQPGKSVELLMEAARFERDVVRDPAAAERHLALALRTAPNHGGVRELYREVAAVVAARWQRRANQAEKSGQEPSDAHGQ
jgi:tetratricopeptide (TPR) repeat protein